MFFKCQEAQCACGMEFFFSTNQLFWGQELLPYMNYVTSTVIV